MVRKEEQDRDGTRSLPRKGRKKKTGMAPGGYQERNKTMGGVGWGWVKFGGVGRVRERNRL